MKRVMLVLIFFHRQCYAWPFEAYFSIVRYMFIVGSISEVCWLTIIHVPPEERAMRQRGIRCWATYYYVNVTFNLFLEVWDICKFKSIV